MEEKATYERYVSVCVLSDPHSADLLCSSFEAAGIPVIIQHLTIGSDRAQGMGSGRLRIAGFSQAQGSRSAPPSSSRNSHPNQIAGHEAEELVALGFRLLVPMHHAQMALKLWDRYQYQSRSYGDHPQRSAAPLEAA